MSEIVKKSQKGFAESVVEKSSAAKELLKNITGNILSVLQPDKYVLFLNMIERFHWYSYVNNLLILSQYPQAQYLAGSDVWKRTALATYNDPNRRFLKSSSVGKGIKLIAPFTVVQENTRRLINVVVPVYDVNQMNDVPIPENDFLDLKKCSYMDIINAINFVAPYRTVFASNEDENLSHNIKGYCNHAQQQFVVDSRLPVRGLLSILLHEFVVAELHLYGYQDENLRGLIVESVFYILIKHFHLSTDDITFSYVSKFKDTNNDDVIKAFSTIQIIAHAIIEKIEEHLEFIVDILPAKVEVPYQTSFFDDLELA